MVDFYLALALIWIGGVAVGYRIGTYVATEL